MIEVKRGEEGFWKTFRNRPVPEEWQQELYNYVIMGWPPGSFHTALFSNDLADAAVRSHPLNTWEAISQMVKWMIHVAPVSCWGNREKVAKWLSMPTEQRRKICEQLGFVLTAEELTWELISKGNS